MPLFRQKALTMNSRLSLAPIVLLLILAQFARAAEGPLQARTWDFDTTIPSGGYRAQKGIDLEGDWNPKVERGAVLDGIEFHGRSGIQHWNIEGAILRKVRISGKRGFSVSAVDSVIEECDGWKDDNWFDFWWSTHWKFTNCIFTKKFVRGDLPPLDYSAHATGCTFYGVKLPWVGMKENPAGYLQKGDMGFEKCRFVQCDVPETFLAGTVDCVFEACQFQAKRHGWPKETTPIKVTAYYAGQGSVPKSFINGPLTVRVPAGTARNAGRFHAASHLQRRECRAPGTADARAVHDDWHRPEKGQRDPQCRRDPGQSGGRNAAGAARARCSRRAGRFPQPR